MKSATVGPVTISAEHVRNTAEHESFLAVIVLVLSSQLLILPHSMQAEASGGTCTIVLVVKHSMGIPAKVRGLRSTFTSCARSRIDRAASLDIMNRQHCTVWQRCQARELEASSYSSHVFNHLKVQRFSSRLSASIPALISWQESNYSNQLSPVT